MEETREEVQRLREMYPRPRVGQMVKLRSSGKFAEVIFVRRARQVLKGMQEVPAGMLGAQARASYGKFWLEVYYEAECKLMGTHRLITVRPLDVAEIRDM